MKRQQASLREHAVGRHGLMAQYDFFLITIFLFVMILGLVMVESSSITIADRLYSDPFYFFKRQAISVLIGLSLGFLVIKIPLAFWEYLSVYLLAIAVVLLVLVLIPGVGKEVNGSMRWISLGPVNLQSSEPAKLFTLMYLAGYLVRHGEKVCTTFSGFIRPIGVVTLVAGLLLLEPDYGAAVVLFATTLGMLFVGGVPLSRFFAWVMVATVTLFSLAVLSPYRMQRLVSFLDPWQDPFNSGFQLTQALIAFGRGEWLGVGLGSSIQKLFYLPEAHTDFVFAVFAEEFGFVGVVILVLTFFFIVWRAFVIAQIAQQLGKLFSAYLAYGIGLLIGLQAFINIGVNMGVLPTKGLTLPLISYGNNSMIISCTLIALLIRIEFENHYSVSQEIHGGMPGYAI